MDWPIGHEHYLNEVSTHIYYTYIWMRNDYTPYYVGKGSGNRAYKKRRVGNPPLDRVFIRYWPSEEEAFVAEKHLISYYGRVNNGTGCLRNLTDGGENPPCHRGVTHPPEWGEKRSRALKGRPGHPQSEATRLKRSQIMKGRTFSKESIQKMRDAQKGRPRKEKIAVKKLSMDRKEIYVYASIREAARDTKLSSSHISRCCRGIEQTAGGFKWEHAT